MLEQAATLPNEDFNREFGGSFPSLRLTFTHLLESDWIWLNRWKGIPYTAIPQDWDTQTARAIQATWTPIQQETQQILSPMLENEPAKLISFTTKKGDAYAMPLWQLTSHIMNHGTYHRGQIANLIRMLNVKPVGTNLFLFFLQQGA